MYVKLMLPKPYFNVYLQLNLIKQEAKMKKAILIVTLFIGILGAALAQDIVKKDGLYYAGDQLYTGEYTEYYADGTLKMQMNLLDGKEDGVVMIYFTSGLKKEQRSYKNGLKDGTWLTWDENQNLTAEANFKDGLKHGHWYVWDANGNKRYDINYENGQKSGDWFMWDENGNLAMERKY